MAYQRENNDIEAIKLKIKETEADINFIGNRIAEMEEPKKRITEEYEAERCSVLARSLGAAKAFVV